MRGILLAVLVLGATPAFAQRTEVALLGGYTTAADIDRKAVGIETLEVESGFTWGLSATHFFSDHAGLAVSWSQQQTGIGIGTAASEAELFDMNLGLLHGSFVYRFGGADARVSPFATAGAGAAFLGAKDLESETKFSWAVGAGLKWFPSRSAGAMVQGRYVSTMTNDDDSSGFCDPFGFCQGSLGQFEITGGLILRF